VDVLEKRLGSLPVIADFSRRLDIAGIIDRACPMRDIALVSHGQVIEALIANRLTYPQAMVSVGDWARDWAVEEVYGIGADTLNDDRLGRALDAIAPQAGHIAGSIGAAAIGAFGIDVTRLHWDMTSISLYGAYPAAEEDHPAPAYGHPKDRRTDLKQIQAGIAVAADGGIPVFHRAYDGGAGEVAQVVDAMNHLKALAGSRTFLMVGDSKLISYANVTAMLGAEVTFIAPLAASRVPAVLLAKAGRRTASDRAPHSAKRRYRMTASPDRFRSRLCLSATTKRVADLPGGAHVSMSFIGWCRFPAAGAPGPGRQTPEV